MRRLYAGGRRQAADGIVRIPPESPQWAKRGVLWLQPDL